MLIKTIHPEVRIIDEKKGIVDYVASDETVDSYQEVIKADGWRFNRFRRNAPFVNSHDYSSIENLLGKVLDFKIETGEDGRPRLVERVQWAIDLPDHKLAQLGFRLTAGGYLRAVSVGFFSMARLTPYDADPKAFELEVMKLGLDPKRICCVHTEQEQIELSSVVIGANASALAKAFHAGDISEEDVNFISLEAEDFISKRIAFEQRIKSLSLKPTRKTDSEAEKRAIASESSRREREEFLREFNAALGV